MRGGSLLASLMLCLATGVAAASEPVRSIELYATTDLHGHLVPSADRVKGKEAFVERGGLAVIGGYLKNARAHYPGRVLLVDGGDLFQGTLTSNLSEGAAMLRGMNVLGYAAAALGNHEFDYGPVGPASSPRTTADDARGALRARIAEAKFPLLAANLAQPPRDRLVAPYTIAEVDGVAIGIIGGTTTGLAQTTLRANLDGISAEPLAPAILRAAAEAKAKGARLLVAVVHAGGECAREPRTLHEDDKSELEGCEPNGEAFVLARALAAAAASGGPRIDALVAGHTHQPITAVVGGLPIIQAGANGRYLAHVSLEVRGRGKTATPTGRFVVERSIELCARTGQHGCALVGERDTYASDYLGEIVPDHVVEKAIAADLAHAKSVADRPIGITLPEGLEGHYGRESALGNYAADVVRAAGKAAIGLVNGGGLRADLPSGALTYGALYESFPFDNQVVTLDVEGAMVRQVVTANLVSTGGALSYSGLHVRAACTDGMLHVDLMLDDGRTVEPTGRYKLATLDFLLRGGDGMLMLDKPAVVTIGLMRDVLEAALHAHVGPLRQSDPTVIDPSHPRVTLPAPRPLHCKAERAEQPPTRK